MDVFVAHPAISPARRLLILTGFPGGLTTFPAFSAESVALLQSGQFAIAVVHSGARIGRACAIAEAVDRRDCASAGGQFEGLRQAACDRMRR